MPISCPITVRHLSPEEFDELDYRVMGHAFASQNELGRLCEEGVYQLDLQARLLADGFRDVRIEVPVILSHDDFTKKLSIDLIADNLVYELKTVLALTADHEAQLFTYLFLLEANRGKLLNLRPAKVEGLLRATGISHADRRRLQIESAAWHDVTPGCAKLRTMMQELLADWGGYLEYEHYQDALIHFFGGDSQVLHRLPLNRRGVPLGTQRFLCHAPKVAFRLSAFTTGLDNAELQLRSLLALSDLHAIQWINLHRSNIRFATLLRQ